MSGRLVAAITKTPTLSSRPSISVRSWFTTLSLDVLFSLPRLGHKLSSSSKKITQGADYFALLKSDLTAFSDSPTYLFSSSGPLIEIKLAFDSFDTALATKVLPHPGGPYNKTPAGADRPTSLKICGFLIGSTIDIRSSASDHRRYPILGFWTSRSGKHSEHPKSRSYNASGSRG